MYKLKRFLSYIKNDIPQGLKNLIRFIPLVWQLRWWDGYWLLRLIQKQLEWMEENWVKNTNHEGDEEIKEKIDETIKSLNSVIKEDYGLYDMHNKKWEGAKTKEDEEKEREEFRNIMILEQELLKHDMEVVFENLKECRKWWD